MIRASSFSRAVFALLASILVYSSATAAADVSKVPPPGIYRFKVGLLDVTALSDGTHPFPVDTVMEGTSSAGSANQVAKPPFCPPSQQRNMPCASGGSPSNSTRPDFPLHQRFTP